MTPREMDRRGWLRLAAAGLAWPVVARAGGKDEAEEVEARARAAGLAGFGRSESTHYLGVGNAPREYREEILAACEAIAAEFVKHFRAKGFDPLALPAGKMIVVVLADAVSYARFAGKQAGLSVGGHYEPDANRLVVFDYRSSQDELAANAKQINSFTLVHETLHGLSFNTGLLDRAGDVPAIVGEGLATYGETWRPKGKGKIGDHNLARLNGFRGNVPWIRLPRLLAEDGLFEDAAAQNVAYAAAWSFVHAHLTDKARLPKFRAYLAAIKGRKDWSHRLDDASAHLGDLDKLNDEIRKYARKKGG